MSNTNANISCIPAGPTCFCCKKMGHIMSECYALEKKNKRATAKAFLVSSLSQPLDMQTEFELDLPKEYTYCSSSTGLFPLLDHYMRLPL